MCVVCRHIQKFVWVNDKPTEARKELRKDSYEHGR